VCQAPVVSSQLSVQSSRYSERTATDEVNNLQPITFRKTDFRPFLAWNDSTIQFNGNTIRFHAEMLEETGEREGWIEIASFPVDEKLHGGI